MMTDVYESTITALKGMPENDFMLVREFINRLASKEEIKKEMYNPYKPLTRGEIIEQLANSRRHADEGMVMDAHEASANIRKKYGL